MGWRKGPRNKKGSQQRLPHVYLDDSILLTDKEAWTWVQIPDRSYEHLSADKRIGAAAGLFHALTSLVRNSEVDVHLRVTYKTLEVDQWIRGLHERVSTQNPTPAWADYAAAMANHVQQDVLRDVLPIKQTWLGVKLGDRGGWSEDLTNFKTLLKPAKDAVDKVTVAAGYFDNIPDHDEIAKWTEQARVIRHGLAASGARTHNASSIDVAWLIAHPLWLGMHQPPPTAADHAAWGPGQLQLLADSTIDIDRRHLVIGQNNIDYPVETVTYVAGMAAARFPKTRQFPDEEPWMHMAANLGFPVEISSRITLVPALDVAKQVRKKIKDAQDQAENIAGSSQMIMPREVTETFELGNQLEYELKKEKMPWARAQHTMLVSAPDPATLKVRVRELRDLYKASGIDLENPAGDQAPILLSAIPGMPATFNAYPQWQAVITIAGGMPHATSQVGDELPFESQGWVGPYLGFTTSRQQTLVHFSPHVAPARNQPPGVAIIGAPGGGKSMCAFTLAYQCATQGVWTIYIDPKADAKPMGGLPGLGKPRVLDLRHGNDGLLDPFSIGTDPGERELLALETLRLLLGGASMSEDRESALIMAVKQVANAPQPSLFKVIQALQQDPTNTPASNLAATLETLQRLPFAKLCFAPNGGDRLRPEEGLTIITLLGLEFPEVSASHETYSYDNRLAVAVMYLLTRYARQLMLHQDKSHPKALFIDEAWAIVSTDQGRKLIPEIARMGRSHNTALILVTQNARDLAATEGITSALSTKFAFRQTNAVNHAGLMDLLDKTPEELSVDDMRDLNVGECIMQDPQGRMSRVYIDTTWNQQLFQAFNTNPETRGKDPA